MGKTIKDDITSNSQEDIPWSLFLKDVLVCSLGAYGGPEAHYGVFTSQMVMKRKYLTEEELVELIALTTLLPGPSSTQTLLAIGYRTGGPLLALLTFLVWALPALAVMTLFSFLSQLLSFLHVSQDGLRYIGPMAVGFIAVAAFNIGKKVTTDSMTRLLFLSGAMLTFFIRDSWIFPAVLLAGGGVRVLFSGEKDLWQPVTIRPPWKYLATFILLALGGLALSLLWDNRLIHLFENFYRYGYLVIGGGQVVVPLMYSELVEVNRYMTSKEFLTGFGLVQGIPGPMFSFSAYAGGMAARGGSILFQLAGALAGGIGIFLPGILLIYFVFPIWNGIKGIKGIRIALQGVTAVAGGLIASAALVLMIKSGLSPDNLLVTALTAAFLLVGWIPAPVVVLLVLAAGFVF